MNSRLAPLLLLISLALAASSAGAVASAAGGSAAPGTQAAPGVRTAATRVVLVRPVTPEGRPAPGWTVRRERGSVDCFGSSPSATDPHIAGCYPTAYALRACWKSAHHTVLCVRDATQHRLTRIRYHGTFPLVHARAKPAPMNLVLGNGHGCLIRSGGAWGAPPQHRNWIGFYSCDQYASVYGPARSKDGIDRSDYLWSVRVWRQHQDDTVRRDVSTAYYVGTAGVSPEAGENGSR